MPPGSGIPFWRRSSPLRTPCQLAPSVGSILCYTGVLPPSIANLHTETKSMLWASLEKAAVAHGVIGRAGTLEFWLDMLPYLLAVVDNHHTLPGPWEDAMPDLHGT